MRYNGEETQSCARLRIRCQMPSRKKNSLRPPSTGAPKLKIRLENGRVIESHVYRRASSSENERWVPVTEDILFPHRKIKKPRMRMVNVIRVEDGEVAYEAVRDLNLHIQESDLDPDPYFR